MDSLHAFRLAQQLPRYWHKLPHETVAITLTLRHRMVRSNKETWDYEILID